MARARRLVRRTDTLGRRYFIDPSTGRRVSRAAWQESKIVDRGERILRELEKGDGGGPVAETPTTGGTVEGGGEGAYEPPDRGRPFPEHVAEPGIPWDFDLDDFDYEAHEVDGDDDTGGA